MSNLLFWNNVMELKLVEEHGSSPLPRSSPPTARWPLGVAAAMLLLIEE